MLFSFYNVAQRYSNFCPGLPTQSTNGRSVRVKKGTKKDTAGRGSRRSMRKTTKRRRDECEDSDSDSEWEPWMEMKSSNKSTKLSMCRTL